MKVAFFGTPAFAIPTLDRLLTSEHAVVVVVTQPDRRRGRGHRVTASDVKARAARAGLPVLQPERLSSDELLRALRDRAPDLGVVAAYGRLLPQALLDLPRFGMINVHASLLPRWRGAAPVQRAILAGDATTGVTIMKVVKALDAGPMLSKVGLDIGPDETAGELERRLAQAGARLLVDTVDRLAAGPVHLEPQDEQLVTYAAKVDRTDSPIDWARPARAIHDQVRGLQPWPQAATWLAGRRLLIRRTAVASDEPAGVEPGAVLAADGDRFELAASPGAVRVLEVQPEGRAPMPARAFLNGHRVAVGARCARPEP